MAFAAATDESRPVLTGVLAEYGSTDTLTFAAADGYRLSVRSIALERGPNTPISVIMPARALQELRRVAPETDKPRSRSGWPPIATRSFSIWIRWIWSRSWWRAPSRTISRSSPQPQHAHHGQHGRVAQGGAHRAFIFARDAANICAVAVVPNGEVGYGRLIVSATSPEHGDNVSELDAHVEGAPIDIAFNARYLHEALSVIDTAQVDARDARSLQPRRHSPVGGGDFTHIIMPMQIAR